MESLERQEIRRILLTRPAVEAGEKLGFLPGDLGKKLSLTYARYMMPCLKCLALKKLKS